jgi:hypothetical protein
MIGIFVRRVSAAPVGGDEALPASGLATPRFSWFRY